MHPNVFQYYDPILAGQELDAFLERHKPEFDRVIYVGDGSNDYCTVIRLRRWVEMLDS